MLRDATAGLVAGPPDESLGPDELTPGYLQVFTPGSRVCYREKGKIGSEVEIIQPTLMIGKLMYQVQCARRAPAAAPVKQWISAEFLEPSAECGEWEYAWWNSSSEMYEKPTGAEEP